MALRKCETFKGLVTTTEGFTPYQFYYVSLDNVKEANQASSKYMGFKILYGCTADGRILDFMKAGNWCKRDLEMIKKLGVTEAGSGCFAPHNFETCQGRVQVTMSFEFGKATQDSLYKWQKSLGMC